MALFTDGADVSIDDLTQYDSGLLDVSAVEGINLTAKLSLAHDEAGIELKALFERSRTNYDAVLTYSHIGLRNLVVTPPVRLLHVYQTLAMVYRDAYFNQLNDRYQAKWKEYSSLTKWAKDKLIEVGVALVTDPVPRAEAPLVTSIAAAENSGTFYFSVSFLNGAGEEGAPSAPVTFTTVDGNVADVQPSNPPMNASAWNMYGGTSPNAMYRQNESPMDIGTDFAFFPSLAATSGVLPGTGQAPNLHRTLPRLLQRG
jgi:hypothetical protein